MFKIYYSKLYYSFMPEIIINSFCQLKGEIPIPIIRELDGLLSFKSPAAEFSRAYGHGWDGFIHLMNPDLSFSYGLLDKVIEFINNKNIKIDIIDNRKKSQINKIEIINRLKEIGKEPRRYQKEISEIVYKKDCGILKIPTGTGKTIISLLMLANLGKKSIYYVTGTDLLYQAYNLFKDVFQDHKIGIIGDGLCDPGFITIVSVWTVGKSLGIKDVFIDDEENDEKQLEPEKYKTIKNEIKQSKVHIFDECSYVACNTIQEIYKNINPEHIYGMSASPWRDTNDDLLIECVLGNRIIDLQAKYFIDNGFLVPPIIKFIEVPKYNGVINKNYKLTYNKYIVENEDRNKLILSGIRELINKKYKTLVLYNSIKHGKILKELISKEFKCTLLSGKDNIKNRQKAKEDIESGKIEVIIASKIFDLGVDFPVLSALILASGGKSSVRALQRIGRVIRPYPNKKHAAIIDFIDNAEYLREHTDRRLSIYRAEEGFKVIWPNQKNQ